MSFLEGKTAPIAWTLAVGPMVLIAMPALLFFDLSPDWLLDSLVGWALLVLVVWCWLVWARRIEP